MSTATLEVEGGSTAAPDLQLSVSQITKFTSCENKWHLSKIVPKAQQNFAGSDAMDLGTLWHRLVAAWRQGRRWQDEWIAALIETVGSEDIGYRVVRGGIMERPGWTAPTIFLRAIPIMEDWCKVRGKVFAEDPDPLMAGASLVSTEMPFNLPIPGVKGARIRGFLDALVSTPVSEIRVHDRLRVIEDKTMGRWGRENQVPFDLQLNVYLWAARQMSPQVDGAVFEAVSTYAYKNGTPEIRFKRLHLDYDPRLVDRTMEDVRRAARRMKAILKNPGLAVRNVGDACTYCDFRRQCLTPWEDD